MQKVSLVHTVGDTVFGVIVSVAGRLAPAASARRRCPRLFISVAVVCLPTESTIVNVSGLTHVPLVIASKKPPGALTWG